jgi:hypothetical protein
MVLTQVNIPSIQNDSISTSDSKTISLTFFNSNSTEQNITNLSDYFYFGIPRKNKIPSFKQLIYNTNYTNDPNNLLTLDGFIIPNNNVSIHYQLKPNNNLTIGYFIVLKFGSNPYLNKTIKSFDIFQIFCPSLNDLTNENNESFYTLFANMSNTINFKGFIGIGIKQLSTNEFINYCSTNNNNNRYSIDKIDNKNKVNFTNNISVRVFLSGCYYINKTTGLYSSYGMEVLSTSNTTYTQCISNHLTEFASGWIVIPNDIDFDYVWSNASFIKNMTIYITVIVISTIYFILLIWAQINDRKDMIKSEIKSFSSNKTDDSYFYEVELSLNLHFNVKMKLIGTNDSSRIFEINENNSNLRYILSTNNSLGKIISIEVLNKEKLKIKERYFISKLNLTVHDLLTREENQLCFKKSNKMFCVIQKQDNNNKLSLNCIASNAFSKLKDKHNLFSIFSKPLYSPFSRTDRLTCLFTLLYMALLIELIFYDAEANSNSLADEATKNYFKFEITPQTVCFFLYKIIFLL